MRLGRRRSRSRFDGLIAGVGSTSGTRVVVGHWGSTPLGAFSDAMVELADGHRVLLADHAEAADFISATYTFDEIRVEQVVVSVAGKTWRVRSTSLDLGHRRGRAAAADRRPHERDRGQRAPGVVRRWGRTSARSHWSTRPRRSASRRPRSDPA